MNNNHFYIDNTSTASLSPRLLSIPFCLTVLFLLGAALFLRPAVNSLSKAYQKSPAKLRKSMKEFSPLSLPNFKTGWKISYQNAQIEDLGTDQYLHILFDRINKNVEPQHMELFLTYYNNPEDKVPHTPDVCSRQAGAVTKEISSIDLKSR